MFLRGRIDYSNNRRLKNKSNIFLLTKRLSNWKNWRLALLQPRKRCRALRPRWPWRPQKRFLLLPHRAGLIVLKALSLGVLALPKKQWKSTCPPGEQWSKAENKSREGQATEGEAGGEHKEDNWREKVKGNEGEQGKLERRIGWSFFSRLSSQVRTKLQNTHKKELEDLSKWVKVLHVKSRKNTISDGGSTALYTASTIDTVSDIELPDTAKA